MYCVSGNVVEMQTLVVGGTRHAACHDCRYVGDSIIQFRSA